MITILKKIFIVIILLIIIDKIFSFFFTEYIFKQTISGESGGTLNYVINKKNNLDFLIIGPSRAKHGIDPTILTSLGTNGYNLGINGTTVLNSLLILDILIKNNVKPKTLIVSADLSDYASDSTQLTLDQIKRVYPYDTDLIREYVGRIGVKEQMKYFFSLYRFNRKILNIAYNFTKKDSVRDSTGYVGLPTIVDRPDLKILSKDFIYNGDGTNAEAMRRVQEICNKNNITLLVVFSPSYQNVFYNKKQQKIMLDDFGKNNIINIIDLSDISTMPDLAKEQNWRDSIHFNDVGSQKFSVILNKEILKKIK
jgi:hypothetical protein